jgi:hypothetical protein
VIAVIKVKVNKWVSCGVIFLGLLVLIFVSIPFWGPAWHLFHGQFLYYREWKIPVPSAFYVSDVGKDRPSMWHLPLGMPIKKGLYGQIGFYPLHLPGDRPFSYESDHQQSFGVLSWQEQQNGFTPRSITTLPIDRTVAYCLEFKYREIATRVLTYCFIDNSRIVMFYDGDRKYVSDFLATLQGMSQVK